MNTVEFLKKELESYEDSFHKLAINYWDIVKDLVAKTSMTEDEAITEVEAIKREVKNRRDFLRQLLKKAMEE